jgi:hypothetical protein
MPRGSLRRARPIIRAHCLQHGLPYVETGLFDSYRKALCPRCTHPVAGVEAGIERVTP